MTTFDKGPDGSLIYFMPKRRIPRNKIREGGSQCFWELSGEEGVIREERRTPLFYRGSKTRQLQVSLFFMIVGGWELSHMGNKGREFPMTRPPVLQSHRVFYSLCRLLSYPDDIIDRLCMRDHLGRRQLTC